MARKNVSLHHRLSIKLQKFPYFSFQKRWYNKVEDSNWPCRDINGKIYSISTIKICFSMILAITEAKLHRYLLWRSVLNTLRHTKLAEALHFACEAVFCCPRLLFPSFSDWKSLSQIPAKSDVNWRWWNRHEQEQIHFFVRNTFKTKPASVYLKNQAHR